MSTIVRIIICLTLYGTLAGCATLGPLYEGFSGHSQQFITNHSERYRIVGDRVYPAWNTVRER